MKRLMVENSIEPSKLKVIEGETYQMERSLYGISNTKILGCTFKGKADGESPLKETKKIIVENSDFDLRYPLWHVDSGDIINSRFTIDSRAPFWYCNNIKLLESTSKSPKIFRECNGIIVQNSSVISEEPFWKCNDVEVVDSKVSGFYAFMQCKNLKLNHVEFEGKYSLQYSRNVKVYESIFNTKDAFWHCNNVVVCNSTIKGEYIGWYSKNMTFIDCVIESHQPFCYAEGIKLINCEMPNSDLAFENSTGKVILKGSIDSIKNPKHLVFSGEVKNLIKENPTHKINIRIKK